MTPILSGTPEQLRRDHTSVKWRAFPADVLPVWVAEMDASPCLPVVAAVTRALERGDTGYTWPVPLAQAFSDYARDVWSWEVSPSTPLVVTDVMVAVSELLRLLTDPGGPVVINTPCYDSFHGFLEAIGRRPVHAPLTDAGRIDLDTLDAAFRAATVAGSRAAYLLCSPHNPTGALHTRDELTAVAELAAQHEVRVVADEIHAPIVLEGTFVPWLEVPGAATGHAVHSASKAWNLAGLKAAIVVPGAEAVDDVRRLHPFVTFGASHLGEIGRAHV